MITIYLPHKVSTENTRSRELLEKDLKVFMTKLGDFCSGIKNTETKVSEGIIVLNSFEIHYSNYRYHLKMLKRLMKKIKASKHFHDQGILVQMRMLTQSAFILLVSSFESFINMLYECFLNEHIRSDKSTLKTIQSLRLENKMKMLSIFCSAFPRSFEQIVSAKSDLYRKFQEFMSLRNNLAHGNFSNFEYTNMAEVDGFLFYLDSKQDLLFSKYVGSGDELVSFLNAIDVTIQSLISKILLMMSITQRNQIRKLLKERWMGYIRIKGGIKFVTEEIW
jgi:hypothetical protein